MSVACYADSVLLYKTGVLAASCRAKLGRVRLLRQRKWFRLLDGWFFVSLLHLCLALESGSDHWKVENFVSSGTESDTNHGKVLRRCSSGAAR